MALRDQPYLPLYIHDFQLDEKLMNCSAESTGVYIRLMCVLHMMEEYGAMTLKAKEKQSESNITNFAFKLSRYMPFTEATIERSLTELIEEGVITLDGDRLYQKRMVRDGEISKIRAEAGRKGGKSPKNGRFESSLPSDDEQEDASSGKSKEETKGKAKEKQNTVIVNVNENENEIVNEDISSSNPISSSDTKPSVMQERFAQFWKAYPRKSGKGAAEKSFMKISPTKELFEQIMAALAAAKMCDQWVKDNGQFVPYPATWLNQRRWEDEYTPSGQKPPQRKKDETPFDWDQRSPFEEWGDSGGR